jgi:hypothetical protein
MISNHLMQYITVVTLRLSYEILVPIHQSEFVSFAATTLTSDIGICCTA